MNPPDDDLARLHAHLAIHGHLVPLPARRTRLLLTAASRAYDAVERLLATRLTRGDRP